MKDWVLYFAHSANKLYR